MRKVNLVTQVIEKRIANADHVLEGVPSERRLSEELGISRTTVRSAVQRLVKQGVLVRENNGRLAVGRSGAGVTRRSIGLVMPIGWSADMHQWQQGVVGALEGYGITLRPVAYTHLGDSVIADAVAGFSGLFFIPREQELPDWLVSLFHSSKCRVVVLDHDVSHLDLPSVIMFPPAAEIKIFDHLVALGHRRIDCLITQKERDLTIGKVGEWKRYIDRNNLMGQLRSEMVERPMESAYRLIRDALAEGRPLASAQFCTTGPAAIGAMRAFHEAGLEIGRDVSVCTVNDEEIGHFMLKTVTSLESPPRSLYLRKAVEWLLGDGPWEGPLLIHPNDIPLYEGESTGPAPTSQVVLTQKHTIRHAAV